MTVAGADVSRTDRAVAHCGSVQDYICMSIDKCSQICSTSVQTMLGAMSQPKSAVKK
jgi:hypothetical protein